MTTSETVRRCPKCGSDELLKIGVGEYQCSHCRTPVVKTSHQHTVEQKGEMSEAMKAKRDELAVNFVENNVCYNGLEYSISGYTAIKATESFSEGFNKCFELMSEREENLKTDLQESNDLIEHLKIKLESRVDVREQRNRFAEKINELNEREQKLIDVIRMQAETLRFYANRVNWNGFLERHAKATFSKVTETLKELGVEL